MLKNKQSHRHSLCSAMSHVLFAYPVKLSISTRSRVTKILQKKFFREFKFNPIKKISFHRHFNICRYQIDAMKHQHKNKLNAKGASHIDFSTRNVIWTLGGGGGARFSVKNRGSFRS